MTESEKEIATGTYALSERAFEPIKRSDPRSRRHREVRAFARATDPEQKPRWNASVKDEAHPFPQNALMHTNTVFNGVDVVTTHFPESVKGTAHLKNSRPAQREVWQSNVLNASKSNRYTYHCDALREKEPPLSYLAQKILEEQSDANLRKRQLWNSSAVLEGNRWNRFVRPDKEPDYLEMNKTKNVLAEDTYVKPKDRVTALTATKRMEKQRQREAALETPLTLYQTQQQQQLLESSAASSRQRQQQQLKLQCGPQVFKMSNIDEWWGMDPVEVADQQNMVKRNLNANPHATYKSTFEHSGQDFSAYATKFNESVASTHGNEEGQLSPM